jgi:DNA-cytosine methyltransferase
MHKSSFNNFLSDSKNGFSEAEGITVLSLFDGMSCGQLALQKLGIKVKQYYAAEIDKHAIQVTQHNFPNTIQLGDVTKVFAKDLPKIDLLIGGSPCQGFSFAGKQLAFDDPRSKLFFEFVRLKNECNPNYFMLENVKMKKEFEIMISKYMGVAPIEINSALLSAQNRVRLYWTNIANEAYGLFGDMQCMIPQPKDKGILLRDILEIDVLDKYYLSEKAIATVNRKSDIGINPKINPDKSGTVTCGNQSSKFSIDNSTTLIVASRGRNPENPKSRETGLNTEQMLEPRYDGKTNCLTSVQKDNLVMQLNQSTESNGCQPYQQNRVYDIDGISPALMAQMSCGTHAILIPEATKKGFTEINPGECFDFENPKSETRRGRKMEDKSNCLMAKETDFMHYTKDFKIRRLTPTECERLQTVPDGYTSCVSDTQRYRMLGNGWTVDVIAHIFSFMALQKPKSEGEKIIKTA